jgi:ribonuclease P protein component
MLPKNYRLKKKKDFERVFKRGKGLGENFLILKFVNNNLGVLRIGFVVGQKVSKKATLRNKVKRRLREVVRANLAKLKSGYDLVFLTKKGIEEKSFREIKEMVEELFRKAKLFKNG